MRRALLAAIALPLASCHGCSDDPEAVKALSTVAALTRDEDGRVLGIRTSNKPLLDSHLASVPRLPRLRSLVLANSRVSDDGLKILAGCPRLEELEFGVACFSDAGLEHLHGLKRLRKVDIGVSRVTDAGIRRLREALPDAVVNGVRLGDPK